MGTRKGRASENWGKRIGKGMNIRRVNGTGKGRCLAPLKKLGDLGVMWFCLCLKCLTHTQYFEHNV